MSYGTVENVATRAQVSNDDLGMGTQSEFENFVQDLLDAATSEINAWLGRDLTGGDKTVSVDGSGRHKMKLPDYPIDSVDYVKVSGREIDDGDYRVESGGILERREGIWPEGWENIEVSYTFADTRTVADEVAEEMAKDALTAADAQGKAAGTESVSMDGYSASFDTSTHIQLTETYRDRLRPFREVAAE